MTHTAAIDDFVIENDPFEVVPVPAFQDNYIWLIKHQGHAAVVDPGDATPVLAYLQQHQLVLDAILVTHHHADHIDGVAALQQHFPNTSTYAPHREQFKFPHQQVREADTVNIAPLNLSLQVLETPGHTAGHVAYYGANCLFCGDTLFGCGCGRLFDGSCEQLHASISRLACLPESTQVFCAHEYTQQNIRFARMLDPENPALLERETLSSKQRAQGQPTLPSTIGMEKGTNPFMRCGNPRIQLAVSQLSKQKLDNEQAVFCAMRVLKNHY